MLAHGDMTFMIITPAMISSMKNALLLIAHGSRRTQSNDEIRALAQQLGTDANNCFDMTDCAFLELAEPSITDGIGQLVQTGAQRIVVLPYFLSNGRHVHEDIPSQVAASRQTHPNIDIELAPYIGTAPAMPNLLLRQAGAC